VLGVIVVGIGIAVGINYFRANAIDSKRDLLTNETMTLANQAIEYYRKIPSFGGGGNSFLGWVIPPQQQLTGSGSFEALVYADSVIIIGTGNEVINHRDSVKVRTTVLPGSFYTVTIN
jgi:hypothetical protein